MAIIPAMTKRRSIRKYIEKPIEEEKLARVLEAGRLAPNANNQQKFKIIVVKDKSIIENMTDVLCGQEFATKAPVILAVVSTGPNRIMKCNQCANTIDCSIVLSFMMLQAAEEGLGTCWLGSFYEDKVKEMLEIPNEYRVVAVTPLGYPDESPNMRPRKDISELICENKFCE